MTIIYQLQNDTERIADVQRATLTTWQFGVTRTHSLFGSDEWWRNIETGKLVVHTLTGVIIAVYPDSKWEDAGFDMRTDSGEEFNWPCLANSEDTSCHYVVGRRAEIDYVHQHRRFLSPTGSFLKNIFETNKIIIEVRIGMNT